LALLVNKRSSLMHLSLSMSQWRTPLNNSTMSFVAATTQLQHLIWIWLRPTLRCFLNKKSLSPAKWLVTRTVSQDSLKPI
jgi:hypothetical protein